MTNKDDLDQLADSFVPSWEDESDHHEVTVMKPLDVEVARKLSEQPEVESAPIAPSAPVVPPAPVTKIGFGSTMIMSSAPPLPTRATQKDAMSAFPSGEVPTAKNLATLSETPHGAPVRPATGLATMVDLAPAGALAGNKPPAAATMVSASGTPLLAENVARTTSEAHLASVNASPPVSPIVTDPVVIKTGPVALRPTEAAAPSVSQPVVEAPAVVSPLRSSPPRQESPLLVSPFSTPSLDDDIVLPKQPSKWKWGLVAVALLGGGAAAFAATRTPHDPAPLPRVAVATTPTDPPASPIPPPPAATKESDPPKPVMPATASAVPSEPHLIASAASKVEPIRAEPPKVEPQKAVSAVKRPSTPPAPPPPAAPAQKPAGKGKGVIVREVPF